MKELDRLLALATLQHTALAKLMRGVHAVAEPVLAMNYGVQALLVGCMRVRPHSFSLDSTCNASSSLRRRPWHSAPLNCLPRTVSAGHLPSAAMLARAAKLNSAASLPCSSKSPRLTGAPEESAHSVLPTCDVHKLAASLDTIGGCPVRAR